MFEGQVMYKEQNMFCTDINNFYLKALYINIYISLFQDVKTCKA